MWKILPRASQNGSHFEIPGKLLVFTALCQEDASGDSILAARGVVNRKARINLTSFLIDGIFSWRMVNLTWGHWNLKLVVDPKIDLIYMSQESKISKTVQCFSVQGNMGLFKATFP